MLRLLFSTTAVVMILGTATAWADSGGMDMKGMQPSGGSAPTSEMKNMNMPMSDEAAHFEPTREAYTTNREFLVKLVSLPDAVPFEKHFSVSLSVFDGKHPDRKLQDANVQVNAGMRHGMKTGFAHGMQYSPRIESKDGVVTVSGLSFHMMGRWTLQVDVQNGAEQGTAYLDLPCCAASK